MKIRLINLYFGKYPAWMPAYLASCGGNPGIDWLLLSDCDPGELPSNVTHKRFTLEELNQRASWATGIQVRKRAYTSVDLKPLYGCLFQDDLRHYDFWGHCDLDVIWGDLLRFFAPLFENHDVISSRKGELSGHLTFWRNTDFVNKLPLESPHLERALSTPELTQFDEPLVTELLTRREGVRLYIEKELVFDWRALRIQRTGWHWRSGTLLDKNDDSHAYIHFGQWKHHLKHIHVGHHSAAAFWITRRGIWPTPPPLKEQFLAFYPLDMKVKSTISRYGKKLAALCCNYPKPTAQKSLGQP